MDLSTINWQLVITILKIVLMVVGVFALFALFGLLRNASKLLKNANTSLTEVDKTVVQLRGSLVPILDKADVTVDAVNAELLRLDGIIGTFETATQKMTHTSETVTEIVNTPVDLVAGFTDKLRKGWQTRKAEAADRK
jgi:ABC-type transporter Mla subunit MlaD